MTNNLIEIQCDSDNIIEYSYRGNSNDSKVLEMKNKLYVDFKEIIAEDLSHSYDMISYHKANGNSYKEDSIVVVFNEKCPQYLRKEFNITDFNSLDCYAIKYYLNSKKRILKTYDLDMFYYSLPQLPNKSAIASQLGVGRTHGSDVEYRDIYLFNSEDDIVKNFWKEKVPNIKEPYENPATKCYGITFKADDCSLIKVKRYLFPFHLEMTDRACL